MTEKRREKLLLIQKREQMKDVLVTKFQERYAERRKAGEDTSEGVIAKEVGEFMDTAAVTENNLKRLEKRIAKGSRFLAGFLLCRRCRRRSRVSAQRTN